MIRNPIKLIAWQLLCVALALSISACTQESSSAADQMVPRKDKPVGKREYGPINPTILDIPEDVVNILEGTGVNGEPIEKAYIYFKSFNLVVYRDNFDVKEFIDNISAAFELLTEDDNFLKAADVWAIQMQQKGTSNFVTIAVNPAQAKKLERSGNMNRFLNDADFLMISDKIIPPKERVDYYQGEKPAPGAEEFTPSP